jgi:hypothetical protein
MVVIIILHASEHTHNNQQITPIKEQQETAHQPTQTTYNIITKL